MKRYLNRKLVRRNHRLGRILVFGGLGMLAGGFLYSLTNTEQVTPVLILAIGGTLGAQFGLALISRWGREPRMDQRLDSALKGLDDRWATLHYSGFVPHMLFGPPGLLALLPQDSEGSITYDGEEWIQDKPARGLLRRGGQNRLDRLAKEASRAEASARSFLESHFPGEDRYEAKALLLFMNDEANLAIGRQEPPQAAVHYKKVKDWLRRQQKGSPPAAEEVNTVARELGLEPPEDD